MSKYTITIYRLHLSTNSVCYCCRFAITAFIFFILVRRSSHQGGSPQNGLGDERTLWNGLGFSLCAAPSVCHVVATSDEGEEIRVEVSTDWCVAVEHRRLSSIRDYLR